MRRFSHHKVRSTDAVAPTLEGCWAYSPQLDCWEYVLWVEPGALHCVNEHGDEYVSTRAIEIEGLSPVKVDGVSPDNFIGEIGYVRMMHGWSY
jgi:hypothetical protein